MLRRLACGLSLGLLPAAVPVALVMMAHPGCVPGQSAGQRAWPEPETSATLWIRRVMVNVPNGPEGDYNRDLRLHAFEDQYIELHNADAGTTVSLRGVRIIRFPGQGAEGTTLFSFGPDDVLGPNSRLVRFGKDAPGQAILPHYDDVIRLQLVNGSGKLVDEIEVPSTGTLGWARSRKRDLDGLPPPSDSTGVSKLYVPMSADLDAMDAAGSGSREDHHGDRGTTSREQDPRRYQRYLRIEGLLGDEARSFRNASEPPDVGQLNLRAAMELLYVESLWRAGDDGFSKLSEKSMNQLRGKVRQALAEGRAAEAKQVADDWFKIAVKNDCAASGLLGQWYPATSEVLGSEATNALLAAQYDSASPPKYNSLAAIMFNLKDPLAVGILIRASCRPEVTPASLGNFPSQLIWQSHRTVKLEQVPAADRLVLYNRILVPDARSRTSLGRMNALLAAASVAPSPELRDEAFDCAVDQFETVQEIGWKSVRTSLQGVQFSTSRHGEEAFLEALKLVRKRMEAIAISSGRQNR